MIGLLEEVAALSRHFGSDPEFTRGGGGNSSGKADGVLYIKPSGVSLAGMTPGALMPLTLEPLLAVVGRADVATLPGSEEVLRIGMAARRDPADSRRPSVECMFHALLPDRIVIHTHPTTVNALTCAAHGPEIAAELFGDDALWIAYTDPGLPLARRIADERRGHERRTGRHPPPVMLLQNHGLIVAGSGAAEIIERSAAVMAAVRERVERSESAARLPADASAVAGPTPEAVAGLPAGAAAAPTLAAVGAAIGAELGREGRPKIVAADTSPAALELGTTAAGRSFVRGGPLTPDQIVYAGSWPLLIEAPPSDADRFVEALHIRLVEHVAATHETPSIVVVEGAGLFAVADTAELAATARDVYLDAIRVADGAARLGGIRTLAPEERRFIEQWEAEAYRRGVAAAGSAG